MSLLRSKLSSRKVLNAFQVLSSPLVRQCHWFPDFKPGDYPVSEEERRKAAKKYNMLPEEYEPYPNEDGCGLGDYPNVPFESVDSKDPYYNWDNQDLRRDYMDPLPYEAVILLPEYISTKKPQVTLGRALWFFCSRIGTLLLILLYLDHYKYNQPVLERQLGAPGVTHYTFELDKEELKRMKKNPRRNVTKCPEECYK